jgi:hypothetical protein
MSPRPELKSMAWSSLHFHDFHVEFHMAKICWPACQSPSAPSLSLSLSQTQSQSLSLSLSISPSLSVSFSENPLNHFSILEASSLSLPRGCR